MSVPIIRVASLADAKELAELAEQTFRDAFAEQNSVEDMNLHCQSNFSEGIQAKEIANTKYITLVAEDENKLVAYALLCIGKHATCVSAKSPGEIKRLYVEKAWHGKGLAQKLMSACLERMDSMKLDVAWLGVWEKNPRAISFYKKFDFHEVGEHVFSLGKDPQRDIVMACQLSHHNT